MGAQGSLRRYMTRRPDSCTRQVRASARCLAVHSTARWRRAGTIQVLDVGVDGAVPEVRGNAASDYEQAWRGNSSSTPCRIPELAVLPWPAGPAVAQWAAAVAVRGVAVLIGQTRPAQMTG